QHRPPDSSCAPAAPQRPCRLSSPIHERNAQRVLAHVLHALQPHADQAGSHALHLVALLVFVAAPQRRVTGVAVLDEYGAATVWVSVWLCSRSNASDTNKLGGSSSSGFGFFFLCLGASSSAALTTAAMDHSPAAITPTERKGRVCGCVPKAQQPSSPEEAIVAPSVTRQHTPSNDRTRQSKNSGEEKNDPKSSQHPHAWRASCSRVSPP
ncbi:hypothetical protein MOQ_009925, partial [Trypanosoma cruzi marinkellei]